MGAFQRTDKQNFQEDIDRVFGLFPRLAERRQQKAGTMSGGEQQMVAMGRALMALDAASRGYVMEVGVIALEGPAKELSANESVRKAYLGID